MYRIVIRKKAKKFIDKLPKNEKIRIVKAIQMLPNGENIKKLKGHSEQGRNISSILISSMSEA